MLISNHEIVEKLAEAPQSAVFKAYHINDPSRPLVLKILKAVSLSQYKQSQFLQKIEHLKVLNDPLVITPVSCGVKDEVCFITQDYFRVGPQLPCRQQGARLPRHGSGKRLLQLEQKAPAAGLLGGGALRAHLQDIPESGEAGSRPA